jgi:hypothetical protein
MKLMMANGDLLEDAYQAMEKRTYSIHPKIKEYIEKSEE